MTLISVPIKTYSSETLIKMMIPFWAHYDSDVNLVLQLIKDTVNTCDFVKDKENTKVFLNDYLDSSIEFKAFIAFDPNG
jgi:small-conductance mechanosensitive channel